MWALKKNKNKTKNLEGTRGTKVTSSRQTPNREAGGGQASRGLPAVPGSISICQLERKPVVPAPRDHLVNEIRKNWGNWSYFKHSFGDLFLDPLLILLQGNHTPIPAPVPTPAHGRCWPLSSAHLCPRRGGCSQAALCAKTRITSEKTLLQLPWELKLRSFFPPHL